MGVGGFFGSMARYGLSGLVSRPQETFPWGTFVANVSGSFVLGFLVTLFAHSVPVHPDLRVALTVGFIGAYTTFSTFGLETVDLAAAGSASVAILNVIASVAVGLLAVWAGQAVARFI